MTNHTPPVRRVFFDPGEIPPPVRDRERELRAWEALIVLALRYEPDEDVDLKHLPELTDAEKAEIDRMLGPDLIGRLLAEHAAAAPIPAT